MPESPGRPWPDKEESAMIIVMRHDASAVGDGIRRQLERLGNDDLLRSNLWLVQRRRRVTGNDTRPIDLVTIQPGHMTAGDFARKEEDGMTQTRLRVS